jgi:hypothetical protein
VGDCLCGARGSGDSCSVVLADRIRLQKSTSGARPIAPAGEEPAETSVGLAVQCESIGQRRNAGSRISVAKPGDRWRALKPNTNGFRESGFRSRRALVDERRSGPWKPSSLTRGRGKRFLVLRSEARVILRALAEHDRERQRRPSPTLLMVENARAAGASPGAMLGALQK